jgi:hypothetical protein
VSRLRLLVALVPVLAAGAAAAPVPAHADVVWLCRPGIVPNPCEIGMRTTVREPSGAEHVEDPGIPADRPVDCFYVYPTVSNQITPNATKAKDPEVVSIAKYQAARFAQRCRVFAPVYRQGTLAAIVTGGLQDAARVRAIAYGDVREAWREYLARDNGGRGVVLLGHSQGTFMLRRLIREEIEPDDAARRRLVSALLLGGNVTVRRGEDARGDFRAVPLCTRPGQFGCVVAYSTFAQDPPANARFGRLSGAPDPQGLPSGPGFEVACTDPARLSGLTGPLRLVVPSEPYAPGVIAAGILVTGLGPPPGAPTPWVVPPDRATGGCVTRRGVNALRYEPVAGSRRPNWFPDPTWGTHLIDVNITLDHLLEIVRRQSERYLAPELRLTRRCVAGGRLRVGVAGDVEAVREVAIKVGRRLVARDGAPPFARVLAVRVLRRAGPRGRLRAVVALQAGAPQRVTLSRGRPRCRR